MAKTTKKTDTTQDNAAEKSLIAENTELLITIPKADAEAAYKKARNKLSKSVKSDGFRKGKTPPHITEQMVGPEKIVQEALQMLVPDAYTEVIKKEKKAPLTQPEFAIRSAVPGEDWEVVAYIAERPEVDVKGYEKVAKAAKKKGQEEAKKQVAEMKKAEEKSTKTDKKKDAAQEDKQQQEAFAKYEKDLTLQHIYQALAQEFKPQIPELLVKEETKHDLQQLGQSLQQHKMTIEQYLQQQNMTFESLSQQMTTTALGKLQLLFITNAIAEKAKIDVSDKEIEASFDKATNDPMLQQYRNSEYYRGLIKQTILREKVADHLMQ